ncbi:calcium binding EGF domain protein [Oesophagostomum dentatum]|uniref:Calcium binding EGF domain protein n=1 Tax=Oesophagostomum dentatum TaxID=61180 RepID=A0A0B1SDT9_OESDE|nr:calcium binding EGF domain protein [Oesophagostomum dentatum]
MSTLVVDECATGQNDCSREAICTDTEDSYVCACPPTYIDLSADPVNRPGRKCLLRINECTSGRHDCSPNADCMDTPESYKCRCRDDFVDESPDIARRPGRICRPALVDECRLGKHDCHSDAFCQVTGLPP